MSEPRVPTSTLVTGGIALLLAVALAAVLLQPDPPAESIPTGPPTEPARPGDLNPIAAKVLAEGGPRTPKSDLAGGPRRATARVALGSEPWTCLEAALAHAARLSEGDPAGCEEGRSEATVTVVRQPRPSEGGVDETPTWECRATLSATLDLRSVRATAGPVPAGEACEPVIEAARAPFRTALGLD